MSDPTLRNYVAFSGNPQNDTIKLTPNFIFLDDFFLDSLKIIWSVNDRVQMQLDRVLDPDPMLLLEESVVSKVPPQLTLFYFPQLYGFHNPLRLVL